MSDKTINLQTLQEKFTGASAEVRRYGLLIFILLVAAIYGFVLYRINSLSNVVPSETAINTQVKDAKVPYIDKKVVKQLQSLQDNSVNVQALFNQARNNPFQ